ncbi:hypothetical protein ASF77_21775 [Massilia sp. Leaf139]|nr:hypothetical protein ASF77_21775 [Massilia sp. Leaf139]
MLGSDPSGRLKRLYDSLTALGLKTRLPPNSETLLFEIITAKKQHIGLAAIRAGHTEVLSFPKPYWARHAPELRAAVAAIEDFHHIDTEGFVSSSQYSLKQIRISRDTIERLDEIVKNLIASHAHKLAGTGPRSGG